VINADAWREPPVSDSRTITPAFDQLVTFCSEATRATISTSRSPADTRNGTGRRFQISAPAAVIDYVPFDSDAVPAMAGDPMS
jgi:hypothetical protein